MSSGPGYALGSGTPPGWTPQQIILYQLSMEFDGSLEYVYLSGSGTTTSTDINSFIQSLVDGTPSASGPLPSGQTPPDLIVTVPCYVVVQLDSSINWAFEPSVAPILTQNNLATKYCALNLVDSSGNIYPATAPSSPNCLILYFSVVSVAPSTEDVNDPFNYYFQFTTSSGTHNVILDPEMKNRGPGG
ncbi:MAG: hypothetical protein ABSD74_13285 [Rhizomicrobium sp.]|jgi:hypothetical protein